MDTDIILWQAAGAAAIVVLACYLFSKRLGTICRQKTIIGALIVFTTVFILSVFLPNKTLILCVSSALYIGLAFFCFRANPATRILWGCVCVLLVLLANILATGIAGFLYHNDSDTRYTEFFSSLTHLMLLAVLFFVATNVGGKKELRFSLFQMILLTGMAILCVVAVGTQLDLLRTMENMVGMNSARQDALFVGGCVLALMIAAVALFHALGREAQKRIESTVEVHQIHLENEYHKSNEISMNALKELRHDMKTHLHVMRSLVEEGKTDDLRDYFNTIEQTYQKDNALFLTGNTMLDAMLTSKQMVAHSDSISVNVAYHTQNGIPLSPTDLCSLVGNLFDNAIEASRKIAPEAREIEVEIGDKDEMVYIKVKNNTDGAYNYADGELMTTKPDSKHGIGLKRIRTIAESAGGFFHINARPDTFTAVVMLPVNKE